MKIDRVIGSGKILKATNVKKNIHPIYMEVAVSLSAIEILKYVKIYNERILASNFISTNKKKEPVVEIGRKNLVGVELLFNISDETIQFYSITSAVKGCGEKIVSAVVNTTPDDWFIVIPMDWSGGFWERMVEKFPRLIIF